MEHADGRHIGKRIEFHDRLDSTNTRALSLADDPANDGVVVLAREQSAGRGQYGRSWSAPAGSSVLLSALVFPPAELRRPVVLTAWAAVSVASVVREFIGQAVKIKWPNDILARGKKLCGILIEQRAAADGRLATVVGIGLNVTQPASWFTDAGLDDAISLACLRDRPFEVDQAARRLIEELDHEYDSLLRGDLANLEALWGWHIGVSGRRVTVERHTSANATAPTERDTLSGCVRNLTFAGLDLDLADGTRLALAPERIKHITLAEPGADGTLATAAPWGKES